MADPLPTNYSPGQQLPAATANAAFEKLNQVPIIKSYIAILEQVGTSAPTATVYNANDANFLGNIVWTRVSAGYYLGTLNGQLPDNKTLVQCQVLANTAAVIFAVPQASGPNSVGLYTGDDPSGYIQNGSLIDIGGSGVFIKIEVYQ